jgi:hypothetical protein
VASRDPLQTRRHASCRQSIGSDVKILFTIKDGNQQRLVWDYHPSGTMFKVPFYDNFG